MFQLLILLVALLSVTVLHVFGIWFADSLRKKNLFNVYFERERACTQKRGRGTERGRHRIQSGLRALGSELSAQSWMQGLNSPTVRP